jgi:hypothetical protein
MKKSIRIAGGIAEFFGTHDGNIKYLESLLRVQVQIIDDTHHHGDDEHVVLSKDDYDYIQLRRKV